MWLYESYWEVEGYVCTATPQMIEQEVDLGLRHFICKQ